MEVPILVVIIVMFILILDTVTALSNFFKIRRNASLIKDNYKKIADNTRHLFGKVKSDEED